ncbi:MAG TPA: DUF1552 domain-containing protein [Polyangiaceae bacterium]
MKRFRIARRHFLRGAGSLGLALPLLDVMEGTREAAAQTAGLRHFIVMYEQSGFVYPAWKPNGSGSSFTLSPTLAPLEPHKSKICVIDGLQNKAGQNAGQDDHQKGMGTMLTGIENIGTATTTNGGGISIDQVIAGAIGGSTPYKSLQFGVQSGQGNVLNYMSWAAAGQGLPCESDPARMYSRIFASFTPPSGGGTGGADPAAVRLFQQRRSILDAVKSSYDSLLPRVSVEDRAKLDAHATAIRSIEARLVVDPGTLPPTTTTAACKKPPSPTIDVRKNDNFPLIGKLQMDLLLMAHACDLTHVSALQFSRESADPVFTWLDMGITRGHHAISHDATSDATSQAQLAAIDKWHAEQYAYLIDGMQKNGLLDSALVVWVNGLAAGNVHSHGPTVGNTPFPQPIVTAGSAGGRFAMGQYLMAPRGTNTNAVYVAFLQAAGIEATTFGNPAHANGPMTGLLV